jgi:hypothetical protein
MSTHPYLRAYLAGVFVPTLILPLMLAGFITVRLVLGWPFPIERFIIFPMSVVPALFGIWNVLYLASHERTHLPLGLYGAILPFLGAPAGAFIAHCLGMLQFGSTGVTWFQGLHIPYPLIACGFLAGVAAYYLVWKYIVGFLNAVLGLA